MSRSLGANVKSLRELRGLTQEKLAEKVGIDSRTIQRIEAAEASPRPRTLERLACALGVEAFELQLGVTPDVLVGIREHFTCPTCGAELIERRFIDHEYGDAELDIFECGHTAGWATRPCPKNPAFPKFEDYELHFFEESNGQWSCVATGLTDMARAVDLAPGIGETREDASRWVRRSYILARDGSEAAENAFPLFG